MHTLVSALGKLGCAPPRPPGALAHLVQDGDPLRLGELPLQQGVRVDGIGLHVGGVAGEQVGQADAGGAIAWGERRDGRSLLSKASLLI